MTSRFELEEHTDQLLCVDRYKDYAPNGLQIEGKEHIKKIRTAVTASDGVINQAIEDGADALLVHHGYFWKGEQPNIVGMKKHRIAKLLQHDINLFAYHLPLDCHPELGNNACLANLLEVNHVKTHEAGKNPDLLWSGEFGKALSVDVLSKILSHKLHQNPLVINGSDQPIKKIAWCSGGAQDFIELAHALGVDAYISGEVSERTYYQAVELGVHYFACGHHATERYGIQALGESLAVTFELEHQFIDSHNPI